MNEVIRNYLLTVNKSTLHAYTTWLPQKCPSCLLEASRPS